MYKNNVVGKEGSMSIQRIINLTIATIFTMVSVAVYASSMQAVSAQEGDTEVEVTTEQAENTSEENTSDESSASYNYVAQPNDSYTKMTRKAVQTYGIESETNLSGAQIVYVETNLTIAAGSPVLVVGDEVSISRALVQEWVEKAGTLTEEQQSAWQVYADRVDFDTNNVGEVRE
jgi:hypothetical protein